VSRDSGYRGQLRAETYKNLPILNEWRRLFPGQDPLVTHEQVTGTQLVCAGGGELVWNDEWQTMESTVYGCPGNPKKGPVAPPVLHTVKHGSFGLTFELDGLRARMEIERKVRTP